MGGPFDNGWGRAPRVLGLRVSVPTLWTVFVINFLALGLIWAYVIRSYPAFGAARFWAGSAFVGAGGAAVAMLHFALDSPVPLLIGGTMLILAACLAAMGINRFYGQPVSWRASAADRRIERCRHDVLCLRARQPVDADPDLFAGPVGAAGADAEAPAVAAGRPRQPRRPARGHRRHWHHLPVCPPHRGDRAAFRRRFLDLPVQSVAVGAGADADLPVDVAEFRFPADGDGPAAQRGRRSRAARRSHRRRQPAASAAAPDRGMRAVRAQRRTVRAAGDRSRRLQGRSTTPTAMPPATPACSISP